jgi:nucleotide-binding universal stress UspA family protein
MPTPVERPEAMIHSTDAIVVGVDGSDTAKDAARWAAGLAARLGTSLHIVHAMPSIGHNLTDTVGAIRMAIMSYQRDWADIIVRAATDAARELHPNLVVTTESTTTPADEALIDLARSARMIVIGNSDVTTAGALLLGSATFAVATHAPCPVVAWRGRHTSPTSQPIVVGTDGTDSSTAALESAFEIADRLDAKLAVVRSLSVSGPVARVLSQLLIDWDAVEVAEWTHLTEIVDQCNKRYPRVSASCFIEPLKPSVALLNRVDADGAQLVVVGSRGRNALTSAVLGSTAVNLLHHATVPVMICRGAE